MDSREVARAAIEISMTPSREEETLLKRKHQEKGISSTAVDYGGEFLSSLHKVVERRWWPPGGSRSLTAPTTRRERWRGRPGKLSPRSCPRP